MEAQHTPGPWIVDPSNSHLVARLGDGINHYVAVAEHEFIRWPRDMCEANARLIAAASDLLAALRDILNRYVELAGSGDCGFWDPETEPEVIAARAALTRAGGVWWHLYQKTLSDFSPRPT